MATWALLCFCTAAWAAPTVLVFGDSLSAGYGLDAGRGWVTLLAHKLEALHSPYRVVNASVSGETSAGGLARLPGALEQFHPNIVLLELGANDGLRGQPPKAMRANLSKMIDLAHAAGAEAVLFEMRIPSNYGPAYTQQFTDSFDAVARDKKVPMVPFFLATVATDRARWFQADGLHPVAEAQPMLLDAVWPTLAPLLGYKGGASDRAAAP